jgi:predicted DNA-binding transcriptional regulator YafY
MATMESAARLLRLLSLLQSRPHWSGMELASRLGVTERTLRRDVTRLRDLEYPVEADPGVGGGYRLGSGGRLPPLLLDDHEAVALAVGLRVATVSSIAGIEDAAVSALAKLDAVLPSRLREQVASVGAGAVQMPGFDLSKIDTEELMGLARACHRSEVVRFRYKDNQGRESARSAEPLRLVHTSRRWYLVARDRNRDAWRTFRVDRISDVFPTGQRFAHKDPPDPVALVSEGVAYAAYPVKAQVQVAGPPDEVRRYIPPSLGVIEPTGDGRSSLRMAAFDVRPLVEILCGLPYELDVIEPDDLIKEMREVADRFARATRERIADEGLPATE